jgi:glycerol uptake facilitator-like aquaporin
VKWSQLPAYYIGEFAGAIAGAFAYLAVAKSRSTAVPAQSSRQTQEVTA